MTRIEPRPVGLYPVSGAFRSAEGRAIRAVRLALRWALLYPVSAAAAAVSAWLVSMAANMGGMQLMPPNPVSRSQSVVTAEPVLTAAGKRLKIIEPPPRAAKKGGRVGKIGKRFDKPAAGPAAGKPVGKRLSKPARGTSLGTPAEQRDAANRILGKDRSDPGPVRNLRQRAAQIEGNDRRSKQTRSRLRDRADKIEKQGRRKLTVATERINAQSARRKTLAEPTVAQARRAHREQADRVKQTQLRIARGGPDTGELRRKLTRQRNVLRDTADELRAAKQTKAPKEQGSALRAAAVPLTMGFVGGPERVRKTHQQAAERHAAAAERLRNSDPKAARRHAELARKFKRSSDMLRAYTQNRRIPGGVQRLAQSSPADLLPKGDGVLGKARRAGVKVGYLGIAAGVADTVHAAATGKDVPRAAARNATTVGSSALATGLTTAAVAATVGGPAGVAVAAGIVAGTGVAVLVTETGVSDFVGDKIGGLF